MGIKTIGRARLGKGSTCRALTTFFEKDGHIVNSIVPAPGAWRQERFDVMRWEIHMTLQENINKGHHPERCYGSWQTITEFLTKAKKYGYHIGEGLEIWANESPETVEKYTVRICDYCGETIPRHEEGCPTKRRIYDSLQMPPLQR